MPNTTLESSDSDVEDSEADAGGKSPSAAQKTGELALRQAAACLLTQVDMTAPERLLQAGIEGISLGDKTGSGTAVQQNHLSAADGACMSRSLDEFDTLGGLKPDVLTIHLSKRNDGDAQQLMCIRGEGKDGKPSAEPVTAVPWGSAIHFRYTSDNAWARQEWAIVKGACVVRVKGRGSKLYCNQGSPASALLTKFKFIAKKSEPPPEERRQPVRRASENAGGGVHVVGGSLPNHSRPQARPQSAQPAGEGGDAKLSREINKMKGELIHAQRALEGAKRVNAEMAKDYRVKLADQDRRLMDSAASIEGLRRQVSEANHIKDRLLTTNTGLLAQLRDAQSNLQDHEQRAEFVSGVMRELHGTQSGDRYGDGRGVERGLNGRSTQPDRRMHDRNGSGRGVVRELSGWLSQPGRREGGDYRNGGGASQYRP